MTPAEITIEEFESGAWVADIISFEPFAGSFDFAGVTWSGTAVSEVLEGERYFSRVIGGKNGLSKTLPDKYYDGTVSAQVAVSDACREAGETFGSATAAKFIYSFERLRGPAYAALDSIAAALELIWWIGRDGALNMKAARDTGPVALGTRDRVDFDASIALVDPTDLVIGGTYDGKPIRFIRWHMNDKRTEAQVYFLPFLFRAPTRNVYDSLDTAKVDRQNADGTIDVIVAGRYGVSKVRLFCGVPGSKVKVNGGEEVTLGYFGGDPQKPFAVAMAQNAGATKDVARKDDSVNAGSILVISTPGGGPCTVTYVPAGGVTPPLPPGASMTALDGGKITGGSTRLKVGD